MERQEDFKLLLPLPTPPWVSPAPAVAVAAASARRRAAARIRSLLSESFPSRLPLETDPFLAAPDEPAARDVPDPA